MITESPTTEAPPRPVPRPRSRRLPVALAIALVGLSGIGLLLLQGSSTDDGTVLGSSSGAFLEAGGPAEAARLKIHSDGHSVSVVNGGSIDIGGLLLGVEVSPYPPTSFDIDVDLRLTDLDGNPIDGATVTVVWDMVIMGHGPFTTVFSPAGDGHYESLLNLFMFGPWELETDISAPSLDVPEDLSVSIYVWPE